MLTGSGLTTKMSVVLGFTLCVTVVASDRSWGQRILDEATLSLVRGANDTTRHDGYKSCDDLNLGTNQITYGKCTAWTSPPILPPNTECVYCEDTIGSHFVSDDGDGVVLKFDGNFDCSSGDKYVGQCVAGAGGTAKCNLPKIKSGTCEGIMEKWISQ